MRKPWSERLKQSFRPTLFRLFRRAKPTFKCPICNYNGPFKDKRVSRDPDLVRIFSKCPGCGANERHRMLYLVFQEVFGGGKMSTGKVLHIAPEACLRPVLSQHFGTYHTADLLKRDVDFNEDIQHMSFADGVYDAVVVARVLTIPPDLEASVNEVRRILKPGGIAIIAEIYAHAETREFGRMVNSRSREMGVSSIELYRKHFAQVDLFLSDRYDGNHQLHNLMMSNGRPKDAYPETVRVPGKGFKDLVAVCRV
jgi:SAM-dependent methyltransferase